MQEFLEEACHTSKQTEAYYCCYPTELVIALCGFHYMNNEEKDLLSRAGTLKKLHHTLNGTFTLLSKHELFVAIYVTQDMSYLLHSESLWCYSSQCYWRPVLYTLQHRPDVDP